jgi:hypothetical protein
LKVEKWELRAESRVVGPNRIHANERSKRSAARDVEMTHDIAQSTPHTMRYVREDFRADVITSCILLWGHLTEWLRWWTRNPLGNSRVGSNPAVVAAVLSVPFGPEDDWETGFYVITRYTPSHSID